MKRSRTQIILALALAAGGAFAQTNKVPGDSDYTSFCKFIAERNIFDPNRQPHFTPASGRTHTRTRTHSASAPAFTFVGTMAYEKGLFAFFNGNTDDLKQALTASEKIAGYTVTEILPGRAVLETADQKEKLELKVGDGMLEENGKWTLIATGEMPDAPAPKTTDTTSDTTNAAPPPANDVLKRLMEQRAKENQ